MRGSLNTIAQTTLDTIKQSRSTKPRPAKRRRLLYSSTSRPRTRAPKANVADPEPEEVYHFIGYVPGHGRVWELDGLKSGPVQVGELPENATTTDGWMDIVRPALRRKMEWYGSTADDGEGDIRFNLLALVDDQYQIASDELELLKREKAALERRLDSSFPEGWLHMVS